jgi:surface protein G
VCEKGALFKRFLSVTVPARDSAMKTTLSLLAATLIAAPLFAQEKPAEPAPLPAEPAAPAEPATPADPAVPMRLEPAPEQLEIPLIPETPETIEKPRGSALGMPGERLKPNKTSTAANEVAERIRFRQAKTKALRDPAVQAEWANSESARTDLEKREALKRYYKLLYARIAKIDSTLKKAIELQQMSSLRRLEQTRIDPTEPLDPDERAAGAGRE